MIKFVLLLARFGFDFKEKSPAWLVIFYSTTSFEKQKIFVDSVNDMFRLVASPKENDLLYLAISLHKLLVNGGNLVNQVNRDIKSKIRFRFVERLPMDMPKALKKEVSCWLPGDSFLEDFIGPTVIEAQEKNLQGFLNAPFGVVGNKNIKVIDIIKWVCHCAGGAHAGEPENETQRLLSIANDIKMGDIGVVMYNLRVIGIVAVKALAGLRDVIIGGPSFCDAPGFSVWIRVLIPFPQGEGEGYIKDFGSEKERNRLSCVITHQGEVVFRFSDIDGNRHELNFGCGGGIWYHNQAITLVVRMQKKTVGFRCNVAMVDMVRR